MFATAHKQVAAAVLLTRAATSTASCAAGCATRLRLTGAGHDQDHSGRDRSAAHPGGNRVLLSDFRFNVPDLEHAFIARIRGGLDENEKPSGNQDGAQNLHNSHVIPLQRLSKGLTKRTAIVAVSS